MKNFSVFPRHLVSRLAVAAIVATLMPLVARAQGGGGDAGTTTPPAASLPVKKNADRTDPIAFLLDKKKPLELSKALEDSLKNYRKEMRHMQDVVFKNLDNAATKKEQGQPPSPGVIAQLSAEAGARIKDIQDAYRDRSRELLNERQRHQIDSLEAIWKRTDGAALPLSPLRRPPPPQ